MLFGCLMTVLIFFDVSVSGQKRMELNIAGLLPLASDVRESFIGRSVLSAIRLALKHVNENNTILTDYKLNMLFNDTRCEMAYGTKSLFDAMHYGKPKLLIFGDVCFQVTGPVAMTSTWWNITQMSFADTNPLLSDQKAYPNLYRTVPSDTAFNAARLKLLQRFKWSRVGTIFQDGSVVSSRYAYAHNDLVHALEANNMDVVRIASFTDDPRSAVRKLKESDVRIIIGNFDVSSAASVFCEAFKRGMFGVKYCWITLGDYEENWMQKSIANRHCSLKDLLTVLEHHISTDIQPYFGDAVQKTFSGLTVEEYVRLYNQQKVIDGYTADVSKFDGYAYDGVWVIALAINNIITSYSYKLQGSKESIESTLVSLIRSPVMATSLNQTDFLGITGNIRFHGGSRLGLVRIRQFQDDRLVNIGTYDGVFDSLELINGTLRWADGEPPRDRSLRRYVMLRVNTVLYVSMCFFATLGLILASAFLVVNIVFRDHSYIKMSSPNLNNLIIFGCMLFYVSVYLLGLDSKVVKSNHFVYLCMVKSWILMLGFTFAFGAMFSKTWRVYAIFTDLQMNRKVIQDYKLFLIVGFLVVVDIAILISWQFIFGLRREIQTLPSKFVENGDLEIIPQFEYCTSGHLTIWLAAVYAYKGILLIIGCFLAWETRYVNIPALNDSKYVGMSVYNVVISCIVGAVISMLLKESLDPLYAMTSVLIIFCTTLTLCLVFVPKAYQLKKDPRGTRRRIRAKIRAKVPPERESRRERRKVQYQAVAEDTAKAQNTLHGRLEIVNSLMAQLGQTYGPDMLNIVPPKILLESSDKESYSSSAANLLAASNSQHDATVYLNVYADYPSTTAQTCINTEMIEMSEMITCPDVPVEDITPNAMNEQLVPAPHKVNNNKEPIWLRPVNCTENTDTCTSTCLTIPANETVPIITLDLSSSMVKSLDSDQASQLSLSSYARAMQNQIYNPHSQEQFLTANVFKNRTPNNPGVKLGVDLDYHSFNRCSGSQRNRLQRIAHSMVQNALAYKQSVNPEVSLNDTGDRFVLENRRTSVNKRADLVNKTDTEIRSSRIIERSLSTNSDGFAEKEIFI